MSEPQSEASRIVGERIRASRQKLGLSQEDIAELAEMHVTNVGKIERGQTNPTLSTLVSLAGAMNVDAADWIGKLTPAMVTGRSHQVTAADLIRARGRGAS